MNDLLVTSYRFRYICKVNVIAFRYLRDRNIMDDFENLSVCVKNLKT